MWAGVEFFQDVKLYNFLSGSMNNCKFCLPQTNGVLQKLLSTKPLWAALESSLSTILVSLKIPPPYFTDWGSITYPHPVPISTDVSLGLLTAPGVLTFGTDGGCGRAHPVSRWPFVFPGAVGLGCVTGWSPGGPGRGRRQRRARRAPRFCPSGCCCLCCLSLHGRLPALGRACKTRRAGAEAVRGLMGGHGAPFPRAALKTQRSVTSWLKCAVPRPTPELQDAGYGSSHLVQLSSSLWCCFFWPPYDTFLQNSFWKHLSLPAPPSAHPPSDAYYRHSLAHLRTHPTWPQTTGSPALIFPFICHITSHCPIQRGAHPLD